MEEKLNRKTGKEERKRFSLRTLIVGIVLAVVLTAGAIFAAAWIILGPEGLSLVETTALINLTFVGPFQRSDVADAAQQAMISALGDRWSYYLDPESYASQQQSRDNSYVGIAVTVSMEDARGLLVLSVTRDGPADKAGIVAGDLIVSAEGVSLAGEARYQGSDLIKGDKGTAVTLEILAADGSTRTVKVVRDRVEEDPVSYKLLDGGVGLVTIRNFFSRSSDELEAAVSDLQSQGARALVFDVRNDPGGYLDALTPMLDYLLPEGPIFRSRTRSGRETVTNSDASFVDLPMAVLVNADSFSAAEFFAAELHEKAGAVVAGTKTYGKGYSQQTFSLLSGGAVGISTRTYLTGEGVSLIGTGITPDPYVELTDEQNALLLQGNLQPGDDPQLQAAVAARGLPEA
jgi:carboxyl-terminal processing protease